MWTDEKTRCIEDPATVGHLRRIFADYDRGLSLRSLGIALEADGVLPPYHARTGSTAWSAGTLRTMLTDRLECFDAITRILRKLEWPGREHLAQPRTRRCLIVDDQRTNGHAGVSRE
jgi:hypothetical protein